MITKTKIDEIWEADFAIASYHMDPFGSLKLSSLFELFQDAASRDATRKGFGYHELIQEKKYWVLLRTRLKINRIPKWEEKVRLLTWPKEHTGIVAYRDFIIRSSRGEDLIVGTSTWTQLHAETTRPVRIDLGDRYVPVDHMHVDLEKPSKIRVPDQLIWAKPIQVKYSQIDVNKHVNNTRYLEWVLNELPFDLLHKKHLEAVEVNFLAEGRLNEELQAGVVQLAEQEWIGSVRRCDDQAPLYVVKLTFKDKE